MRRIIPLLRRGQGWFPTGYRKGLMMTNGNKTQRNNRIETNKLFTLEFSFIFACLPIGKQALRY
ncbi:MAG: hypothetical protein LBC74_07510 [Planctomycetaceae bacterium]|nr:hypothetical protein [Planctomycetaceae bacterium]